MPIRVYYEVLNQKGSPALYTDTYINRPTFGYEGRLFISTDTGQIFEDTGTAWNLVADAGVGGGTLSSVCVNGNTTNTGIVVNGITFDDGAGTGTNNVSIGTGMPLNTTGLSNTSLGNSALGSNTIGSYSTAIGQGALQALTTGGLNTAVGQGSLLTLIAGSYNTALGQGALNLATASYNTGVGQGAGGTITTGANNICVGYQSGSGLTTGSNNTILGSVAITTPATNNHIFLADGAGNVRLFSNASGLIAINQAITNTPSAQLDIHSAQTYAQILNGTGTSNAYLGFSNAGSIKWRFGNNYNGAANTLDLYNVATSATALSFNATTNISTFSGGNLIVTGTSTSTYGLQINNSLGNPAFVAYQNSDSSFALQIAAAGSTTINLNSNASNSYINTAGNFGLGNNSPSYKLDVTGSIRTTAAISLTGTNAQILTTTSNNIAADNVAVLYNTNSTGYGLYIGAGGSASNALYCTDYTRANNLFTVRGDGNVLVGTSSTTINSSNFGLRFALDGTLQSSRNVNGTASVAQIFGNAGSVIVYGNGNLQNTNGSYGTISDIRLKENINDATNKLDDLLKVRIVNYNLLQNPDEKLLGVVAQELEQIFPALIEINEEGFKGVKYSIFIPMLIKAIQELNQKIENLN